LLSFDVVVETDSERLKCSLINVILTQKKRLYFKITQYSAANQIFHDLVKNPFTYVQHHVHFRSLVGVTRVQRLPFSTGVFVAKVTSNCSAEIEKVITLIKFEDISPT